MGRWNSLSPVLRAIYWHTITHTHHGRAKSKWKCHVLFVMAICPDLACWIRANIAGMSVLVWGVRTRLIKGRVGGWASNKTRVTLSQRIERMELEFQLKFVAFPILSRSIADNDSTKQQNACPFLLCENVLIASIIFLLSVHVQFWRLHLF